MRTWLVSSALESVEGRVWTTHNHVCNWPVEDVTYTRRGIEWIHVWVTIDELGMLLVCQ